MNTVLRLKAEPHVQIALLKCPFLGPFGLCWLGCIRVSLFAVFTKEHVQSPNKPGIFMKSNPVSSLRRTIPFGHAAIAVFVTSISGGNSTSTSTVVLTGMRSRAVGARIGAARIGGKEGGAKRGVSVSSSV